MKQIKSFYSINSPIFRSNLLYYNYNNYNSNKNMFNNNNSIEILSYNENTQNIDVISIQKENSDKSDSIKINNKEKVNDTIIIDKITKEIIQQEIKEKIYLKKPFKEKKKLGRKVKSEENLGEHNKFSDDNIIRKIKNAILNSVFIFINENLRIIYSNLNKDSLKEMQLFKLKQNITIKGKADYNKNLLNRELKSIFSEDISDKYTRYSPKHNKDLIEKLLNEKDENKREFFNKLFNLTFLDCLNHFRGSTFLNELNGLKQFEKYFDELNEEKNNEMYKKIFKYFLNNFDKEILEKKERKRIRKK